MITLTIELPETLAEQVQARGLSQKALEKTMIHLLQAYLQEFEPAPPDDRVEPKQPGVSGQAFARRMIARNRELFEELARL